MQENGEWEANTANAAESSSSVERNSNLGADSPSTSTIPIAANGSTAQSLSQPTTSVLTSEPLANASLSDIFASEVE